MKSSFWCIIMSFRIISRYFLLILQSLLLRLHCIIHAHHVQLFSNILPNPPAACRKPFIPADVNVLDLTALTKSLTNATHEPCPSNQILAFALARFAVAVAPAFLHKSTGAFVIPYTFSYGFINLTELHFHLCQYWHQELIRQIYSDLKMLQCPVVRI